MRKMGLKRVTALVLSICMVFGGICFWPMEKVKATTLNNPRKDSNGNVTYDCVWFGSYPQSDATGVKKDPIKWRVLEVNGDDAFLVADCNLDVQRYNDTQTDVTWETSTMRQWLNSDFMNRAFTSSEQSAIKTTTVVNADNPEYGTEGGNNTQDKVFLLSIDEGMNEKYGFSTIYSTYDKARQRKNTAYVAKGGTIATSDMNSETSNNMWWLRSPGGESNCVEVVDSDGHVSQYGGFVDYNFIAVCPVLYLNFSSSNLWSYAGTVCSDGSVNENKPGEGESTMPVDNTELAYNTEPAPTTMPVDSTEPAPTTMPVDNTEPAYSTEPAPTTMPVDNTEPAPTTTPASPTAYVQETTKNNNSSNDYLAEKKKQFISAISRKVAKGTKPFYLNAKTDGDGQLTYKSSNSKVVKISSTGKVEAKDYGVATITIKASATARCYEADKKITITVVPKKMRLKKVFSTGRTRLSVSWKKNKKITRYEIYFSARKDFKRETYKRTFKNSKSKMDVIGLKSRKKYYVKIRCYKVVGKKKYYSAWSKVRSVKVK